MNAIDYYILMDELEQSGLSYDEAFELLMDMEADEETE